MQHNLIVSNNNNNNEQKNLMREIKKCLIKNINPTIFHNKIHYFIFLNIFNNFISKNIPIFLNISFFI